jgi:hypothetical protein
MIMEVSDIRNYPDLVEDIEKSTLRMVTQAIYDYRAMAQDIFKTEFDPVSDIGEDITREALDRLGMSRIDQRLFGKIDYKRARYLYVLNEQQRVNDLKSIIIAAVPNGMLQDRYNPKSRDTIWLAGRNAPSRGEEFRVRLSLKLLKTKAPWRVQEIPMPPADLSGVHNTRCVLVLIRSFRLPGFVPPASNLECPVPALSSQFSVLNSQFSILSSQFLVLSS